MGISNVRRPQEGAPGARVFRRAREAINKNFLGSKSINIPFGKLVMDWKRKIWKNVEYGNLATYQKRKQKCLKLIFDKN